MRQNACFLGGLKKKQQKTVMCFLREVYFSSGTELMPFFPYFRAGLLKKGAGNVGISLVTGQW